MSVYGPIIRPQYFEAEDEAMVAAAIQEYYAKYRRPPVDVDDLTDILDTTDYNHLVHSIYLGLGEWDLDYASDRVVEFAQQQAARIAVLESLDDVESGNLSSVVDRLKAAMRVGMDITDTGLDIKNDLSWVDASVGAKLPTGILHLDIALEGGLAKGELGIILSPPNYGKSMTLINIGHGAMGPLTRANVAHLSFEISAEVVAKRYGARTIFRFPNRSGDNEDYKEEYSRLADVLTPGNVRAFRMQGTCNDIRARLDNLIDNGYPLDLVIVDYGDEVDPIRPRPDRYYELGDIFGDMRKIAFDYDVPLWTATQATRGSLGKEVITMGDLAESFKKAAKADVIVAVCQTPEEEAAEQCRLFVAKMRDGRARAMVKCKYYVGQQAVISTGFAQRMGSV